MRRTILAALLLAGVAALPGVPARAAVSADINVHIGERYPVEFRRAPRVYAVPQSNISWVPDQGYDMYQSDDRWYINDGGSWYCANSYRGPFIGISYQSVPWGILQVPSRYHNQTRGYWNQGRSWQRDNWSHRGQDENWRGRDQGDYRGGHGRGHGRGHGHCNGGGDQGGRGDNRDDD